MSDRYDMHSHVAALAHETFFNGNVKTGEEKEAENAATVYALM